MVRFISSAFFRLAAVVCLLWSVVQPISAQDLRADRTPAEDKISSNLIFATRSVSGAPVPAAFQPGIDLFLNQNVAADQTIFVVIKAKTSSDLTAALVAIGAYDISEFAQYDTVTARVPIGAIQSLALRADIRMIREKEVATTNRYFPVPGDIKSQIQYLGGPVPNAGSVTWEGVPAHKAGIAQSAGAIGTGVKVCVLSDGVNSLAARQASGDLGPVTVLAGQAGSGDEGTAMLEIIHDMAPGATLAFATAFSGTAQFATNILNLRNITGCNIIVDDVSYFNEGVFQDDIVAQAVNTVTASGALYFSSAANSGNLTHGTSGTFEGDFVASAAAIPPALASTGVLHSFGANPYTTLTASAYYVSLHWSDPLGASTNDYDLFITDSTGTTVLGLSNGSQNGSQDAFEYTECSSCPFPVGSRIYILKKTGVARAFHLDTHRGRISNGTTGSTYGHNAAGSALSVAAVDVRTASGGVFVGGGTNPVTYYSSDGPRKIFYTPAGSAITPGNVLFSSGGGTTLAKVDLAASDCGTTTTPGFAPFCGTSAAAPTAAALAALYQSAYPSFTSTQIVTALKNSALDIEAAGMDRDSGVGIVMAPVQPGVPTNVTFVAVRGGVSVSFTAPSYPGGSGITGYTVTCTAAGQTTRTNTAAVPPITVTGLTPGVPYSCSVTASNATSTSAPSTAVIATALPLQSIDITPILMLLLLD